MSSIKKFRRLSRCLANVKWVTFGQSKQNYFLRQILWETHDPILIKGISRDSYFCVKFNANYFVQPPRKNWVGLLMCLFIDLWLHSSQPYGVCLKKDTKSSNQKREQLINFTKMSTISLNDTFILTTPVSEIKWTMTWIKFIIKNLKFNI